MRWSCVTSWSLLCGVPLDGSLVVFVPWAAPSRGAGLFCCCKGTDRLRSICVIVRHPRRGALTAMQRRRRRAAGRKAACSGLPVNARNNISSNV